MPFSPSSTCSAWRSVAALVAVALAPCAAASCRPLAPSASPDTADDGGAEGDAEPPRDDARAPGNADATSGPTPDAGAPESGAVDGDATLDAPAPSDAEAPDAGPRADVVDVMERVADWQTAQLGSSSAKTWIESTFYAGLMAAYRTTQASRYLVRLESWGAANQWTLGPGATSADDQCAGQAYLEVYALDRSPAELAPTRAELDAELASPAPGRQVWWWCDALFMAPAVFAKVGAATSSSAYADGMDAMWWDTTAALLDPSHGLFWRDASYIGQSCPNGQPMFWSRGNGWVAAGLARVLEALPASYASRGKYVALLQSMAARLLPLQRADGFWSSCLTDSADYPEPESSGTSAFTYAFAWGIRHGVLDAATYLPAVQRAWPALAALVDASGKLGYVQLVGSAPGHAAQGDTSPYGPGLFLLAGSEVAYLPP